MPSNRPLLRKTHVTSERPPFERIALVLQGGGPLGPIRAAFTKPWRRPICIPTGSPAFRSERLIQPLLPAIRRKSVSRDCGNSGKPSAPPQWGSPIFRG